MVTADVATEDADAADSGAGLRLVLGKDGQPPPALPTGEVEYEGSSDDDDAASDDDAAAEAAAAPTGADAAADPPDGASGGCVRGCWRRQPGRCGGLRYYHRARASSSRVIAEARQRGCRQRCSR